MSIDDLQKKLDASSAGASKLSRSLFKHKPLAAEVVARVNHVRGMTVATTLANGSPHAVVVIGAAYDGDLFFTATPGSALLRNLQRDPRMGFTVTDGSNAIVGRGSAELVGRALERPDLIARLAAANRTGRFTPEGWDGFIYRIALDRIFAD